MKFVKTFGVWIVVIVLLLLWHHYLVSSRPPKLKSWESCKTKLLDDWLNRIQIKSKRCVSSPAIMLTVLEQQAQRTTSTITTAEIQQPVTRRSSVFTEDELIRVDRRIADECGPFPRE